MDITQLYDHYGVPYATDVDKHYRPGWINTECPYCSGNPGFHLGFDLAEPHYYCWRCGWKPVVSTVAILLKVTEQEARIILKRYDITAPAYQVAKIKPIKTRIAQLPYGLCTLTPLHLNYLKKREFDPDKITRIWSIIGTGPMSQLDNIDYKHRILIPYIWDGEQVSFTARDVTGKNPVRYRSCPADYERVAHKDILYGKQEAWGHTGICVEGPTDVWRFGLNSFATSGIEYTARQVRLMSSLFHRIFVVYDDDPQAIVKGKELVSELKFRGVDAYHVPIVGDPGGMKQDDADHLVRNLLMKTN